MKTQSLLLLTLAFLAFSCKKDPPIHEPTEPVMPPLTHQGLNTFGCYINGELFVANEGESVWSIPPVSGSFNENSKFLNLQGNKYVDSKSANISISAYVDHGTGEYKYEIFEGHIIGYRDFYDHLCDYYYEDIPDLGQLTITYLNEEKNIISGTFYINLVNASCEGDTLLKITDGRFDFHY